MISSRAPHSADLFCSSHRRIGVRRGHQGQVVPEGQKQLLLPHEDILAEVSGSWILQYQLCSELHLYLLH